MSEKGFLVISDITDYTAYLSQSELEHAHDILSGLMNTLLEHTRIRLIDRASRRESGAGQTAS